MKAAEMTSQEWRKWAVEQAISAGDRNQYSVITNAEDILAWVFVRPDDHQKQDAAESGE